MDSVAQWQQIDHRYGSVQALQGFSLNLRPGQITALLGPNGAGKSTAIGLLLGLLRVQGGRVSLFGQPPQQRSARLRLGAMLQRTDLPDSLRVGEHLQLFARYYANPLPVDEVPPELCEPSEVTVRTARSSDSGLFHVHTNMMMGINSTRMRMMTATIDGMELSTASRIAATSTRSACKIMPTEQAAATSVNWGSTANT